MAKVVFGMTISLDGFVNDRNGSVQDLYPNLDDLRQTALLQDEIRRTGAVVMGRRAYDMAQGDFTGYEFQVPIFVLTHRAPAQSAKGENAQLRFTFVTDGVRSAIEQARAAAGDQHVTVIGGPSTGRQLLQAGLVDELEIGIVPVLLGQGLRLFEPDSLAPVRLEKMDVINSPGRTDLRYRVL
jgi:dihydrofolate reductase